MLLFGLALTLGFLGLSLLTFNWGGSEWLGGGVVLVALGLGTWGWVLLRKRKGDERIRTAE